MEAMAVSCGRLLVVEGERGGGRRLDVVESEGVTEERVHGDGLAVREGRFLLLFHLMDHNRVVINN